MRFFFVAQLIGLFCLQAKAIFICPANEASIPMSSQTILGFSGDEALASHLPGSIVLPIRLHYDANPRDENLVTASLLFEPSADFVRVFESKKCNDCIPECTAGTSSMVIDGNFQLQINERSVDIQCPAVLILEKLSTARLYTWKSENTDCDSLSMLPGPTSGTSLILDMENGQYNGEIVRGGFGTGVESTSIGTIGEGLWDWLRPGYEPDKVEH